LLSCATPPATETPEMTKEARRGTTAGEFRLGKNFVVGKNYSIECSICEEDSAQAGLGLTPNYAMPNGNRFRVNLLGQSA
jgi:hypothetical protein